LLFKLTGQHQTDPSNAGRTMLFNIHDGNWDKELLDIFGVPEAILPEVKKSCGLFANTLPEVIGASVPVCGIAGDQQASLFGQACFSEGDIKNTYGTGCFSLVNTGTQAVKSEHRLLTTVAWDIGNGLEYALEGSVFIAGAVIQWLRDQLGIIEHASESEKLARQVDDNGGVYLVPAFVGMGAPYWDSAVRGTLFGLTRCSSKSHIARAALESIAFQTSDLLRALQEDLKQDFKFLKADGGATANSFLMQFQTDLLEIPLIIPGNAETTALGAAYLAGLHCGIWNSLDEIRQNWHEAQRFTPSMANETRNHLLNSWQQAVKSARAFQG
jgi:glycerol kinase